LIFKGLSLSNFEKGKQIPTKHRWDGTTLRFQMSDAAMKFIYREWPNFIDKRAVKSKAVVRRAMTQSMAWEPRLPPFPHQTVARDLARGNRAFAYFMDMGTGKSKTNIDALVMRPMVNKLIRFTQEGKTLVAVDESQKIKNSQSNRASRCFEIGDVSEYRRILTGTPMAKGPEDYFSQFRFLDIGIIGVNTFSGFKRQYCEIGGFNGTSVVGYRNVEQLHELIAPYCYRIEKSECIDLPPKMYQRISVELSAEQRTVYNELKQQLLTELSDGTTITVEQAVQRILRLQQVVQGFLPREDGSFEEYDLSNRMEALDNLIDGSHTKVVIWCRFRHDIDLIMNKYREIAVRYDGEVSGRHNREAAKQQFINDEATRLFVSNAMAGGAGLDGLQHSTGTVVYFSNSFSSLDRWQSEDRTHRIGTKGTVTYYDIAARGTIDLTILANLRRKKDITDMSLNELRSLIEVNEDASYD
jgi:SNF2 family DNA or RNA helicase